MHASTHYYWSARETSLSHLCKQRASAFKGVTRRWIFSHATSNEAIDMHFLSESLRCSVMRNGEQNTQDLQARVRETCKRLCHRRACVNWATSIGIGHGSKARARVCKGREGDARQRILFLMAESFFTFGTLVLQRTCTPGRMTNAL